jgi:hypothetical protein
LSCLNATKIRKKYKKFLQKTKKRLKVKRAVGIMNTDQRLVVYDEGPKTAEKERMGEK